MWSMWPIVSNIGTATYDLTKDLPKLLSPLSQLEYTTKNTKQLVEEICLKQVSDGYKMVLFDIKSLVTNVPLKKQSKLPYREFTNVKR